MSKYPYLVRHDGIDYAPGEEVPDDVPPLPFGPAEVHKDEVRAASDKIVGRAHK
jgi:hypothetical protein